MFGDADCRFRVSRLKASVSGLGSKFETRDEALGISLMGLRVLGLGVRMLASAV